MVINGNFFLKKIMKKIYMTPVAKEIKLNYQFSLLSNSITLDVNNDITEIVDDGTGDLIDTNGDLDPEAREFDLDEEEYF